jgi:hypothetical protein
MRVLRHGFLHLFPILLTQAAALHGIQCNLAVFRQGILNQIRASLSVKARRVSDNGW